MTILIALLCFGAVYLLQSMIYRRFWYRNLSVELNFQSCECMEGERILLKEVVRNAKRLPLPVLHVKFRTSRSFLFDSEENSAVTDYYYRNDIYAIGGRQIITRLLPFVCSKRGCYEINEASLLSTDLFLTLILFCPVPTDTLLYVYPKRVDMSSFEIPYRSITGEFITNNRLFPDPFEFRGIRNYQPFDRMRSINWKSSAKNNTLLVNTYYQTASRNVKIFLNLDRQLMITEDEIIEYAIRIAGTLANRFIADQVPLSMVTNARDVFADTPVCLGTGSGTRHITAIDRGLARIDLKKKPSDFLCLLKDEFSEAISRNTYYIIISNNRKPELINYYARLKEQKAACSFIIPEKRSGGPVSLMQDMFLWEVPE